MPAPLLPVSAAPNNWLSTYTPGATLVGDPTKDNQLAANAPNVTLVGGPHDDTFIIYDPSDKIIEQPGGGIDTVKTWGSGYTLPANVENLTLMGTSNAVGVGNSGDNLIICNGGNDRITTGGGNDVLVAGSGSDYFIPTVAAGTTTWIEGFKTSGAHQDKLDLYGYGLRGFDGVHAAMTQVGSDVQISLANGQKVMLANQLVSNITASNVDVEFSPQGMRMTFDEEFNSLHMENGYAVTSQNIWDTTLNGGLRTLSGNHELETYVDPSYKGSGTQPLGLNPFSVSNGVLTIAAAPTPAADLAALGNAKYYSGVLTTEGSFAQTYGYFEMRAEVPAGKGLWPAFWLLPADGTWPPELDIMEQIGSVNNYISTGAIDGTSANHTAQNKGTYVSANTSQAFHTYSMNWTASTITWYFDGQQIYQIATPADMNKPMYMLVNLAVGGTWPGSPDATTNWSNADYKIDYIRAYADAPTTSASIATTEVATTAPAVTLYSALNSLDYSSTFSAPATGPGTSTTYTAQQLGIKGVNPATTVTVAYGAHNELTITDNYKWGSILDALINTSNQSNITINNIVNTTVHLGDGDNVIHINDAMRGAIVAGSGNNVIAVTALSNAPSNNLMAITVGDGNNAISFDGGWNATTTIKTGSGNNSVTITGQAIATVQFGTGNDLLTDRSTGAVVATGGGGSNVYEFVAGAQASVANFHGATDTIVLDGMSAASVHVVTGATSTTLDVSGGGIIQLVGVSLQASAIHILYA